MTVCKFYQQGTCKFGNSCRFEHPARSQPQSNRFGPLAAGAPPATGGGGTQNNPLLTKYNISADVITKDLTIEKPQWILSAYAPGRDAPDQLFGGFPREQSFEELRLHYMAGKASGNEQQALSQAQELYQNAQQQMENALRNAQEAAQFVAEGENRHPNRHDVCREGTQGAPFGEFLVGRRPKPAANAPAQPNPFASGGGTTPSAFGGGAPSTSAFGQPSALGQRPNSFGNPAFGQPAQPSSSPFGQAASGGASAFGQVAQPASGFGQPSALGAKPNPFSAPAFGQPAQPAQSSAPGSAFGQPSAQGNAFGQPSQLGQTPNSFATNANAGGANSSPFATMGTNGNSSAPAMNPFGAPSSNQANATASPFGQPPAQAPNPFASAQQQPAQEANNPFAQNARPSTNGTFGQPANPFAQKPAQNAADPMAQQQAGVSRPNAFGAPQTGQASAAAAAANPYPPGSTRQHPPLESYATKGMDGRLATFKGKPVAYKDGRPGNRAFDGTWTRIWFPDGPPAYCKDTELPPQQYDDKCKAQWEAFAHTETFAGGRMPELPPPREYTRWDF
ncbi:zinc finger C-X8-C-X5-C-X3-H type (and similar) domain-containing protein [Hirsutella rhossiliensis]|uniref:Zinc finger c-x8-C-x5-C-x3-H type (And similar) domain-containing protein n=1 Tax=Hirsutella rhossiliensis TaxID=111463 RepID=A0A9P8N3S1_9HYPO|nr:zinc finger c-x8-C-x5-C-x3-H type (and similar) domain-containing protein [Hirsutella rhossiliensis]KAH0965426.1 zinc finger c-x8-C-x5-C-x3-H type (and similar) domain-containing protein [Hirsutella rhossiliensis]